MKITQTVKNNIFTTGLIRILAVLLVAVASASQTFGAIDVFLKVVGDGEIKGESTDAQYPGNQGWFHIQSFRLGVENSLSLGSASGGAGAGKASFIDFDLDKSLDSASPKLFLYAAQGKHFNTAQLVVRKSGQPEAYLTYDLKLVVLTSQQWSGSDGDDAPKETIKMKYGAVKITYRPMDPKTGKLGTAISGQWDITTNSEGTF